MRALGGGSERTERARPRVRLLPVARVVCMALIVVAIVASVASVPTALTRLNSLCKLTNAGDCPDGQVNAAGARALLALGIFLQAYAIYTMAIVLFATAVYVLIALIILWRRSDEWLGLFTALFLVTFGIGANGFIDSLVASLTLQQLVWKLLLNTIEALGNVSIVVFFFVFPSGRFVPRWTMWVALLWCVQVPAIFSPALQLPDFATGFLFVATVLIMLAAMIYRYRHVSSAIERQQTKWVVYGAVLTGLTEVVLGLALGLMEAMQLPATPLLEAISYTLFTLVPLSIPLSIGVAILRYRLYDIDVIIRRTLIYGLLTAILAALYFIGVVGTQTLVGSISGNTAEQRPLIIVATTLLIAALFQPLRHRLQSFIDRRFYRRKYDAERTLTTFAATLREQVDLPELRDHLLATVDETMQPLHLSVWFQTERGDRGEDRS